jgi:hypothetical protein
MAKEYTVRSFKKGDYKDNFGNTWCDMVLEENPSEPVRIVVKDPDNYKDGMKLYGEVKLAKTQAGKAYYRFYKEQQPETPQTNQAQGSTYNSDGAKFGNCMKIATEFYLNHPTKEMINNEDDFVNAVQSLASRLFKLEPVANTDVKNIASTFGKDVIAEVPEGEFSLRDIPF